MIERIKSISLYIVIGLLLQGISFWIQSDFLGTFLDTNLITLLLALLAINTTTMSVIMTKLQEISEGSKSNFSRTINSMKESIIEQVWLIGLSGIVSMVKSSAILHYDGMEFITNTILLAIFIYAIQILYDTANGVFIILHHEDQQSNGNGSQKR